MSAFALAGFDIFDLFEEFLHASLRDALVHLAGVVGRHFPFVTLHRERFTRAGLAVSDDCPVVPFNHSVDKSSDA